MSSMVPKPMTFGIDDVANEGLGVLRGLALVAVDAVGREILVAERIAGDLAIVVDHAGHHLDQRGLAGARLAVAHEGEDETAKLGEGVQLALEIIGHQHLGKLHGLVLGDVVADHLFRLLEGHGQRGGAGVGRRREARDFEIVGLDPVAALRKRGRAR